MRQPRIIAIGDAVCDKYLSRGKMYPGGQCVNTCAYAHMNNAESAFLGKFGNDEVAECIQAALKNMNVDFSHSRNYEGENGFACVTLNQGDRVFIGSNHGIRLSIDLKNQMQPEDPKKQFLLCHHLYRHSDLYKSDQTFLYMKNLPA